MPIRISLTIKAIIIGVMLLLSTISFAVENRTVALLQFLDTEYNPVLPLLSGSLAITDSFKPSTAAYAGTVAQLQGTAYVYHNDGTTAYKLKRDLPVFSGDTLVTAEKSSITLQMTDASTLTLAAQTKLVIDRSLPIIKVRDTALQLLFGRVRAQVKKLAGEYIIRTTTATLSVQESDFAVAVAPAPKNSPQGWGEKTPARLLTAVLTGGNPSTVELAGFFGPSIRVKPFSVARVRSGSLAEQAVYVGPDAMPLLQRIAPAPQTGFRPSLPKKPAPAVAPTTAPCWPFSNNVEELKYFKMCKPGQKNKLWQGLK